MRYCIRSATTEGGNRQGSLDSASIAEEHVVVIIRKDVRGDSEGDKMFHRSTAIKETKLIA